MHAMSFALTLTAYQPMRVRRERHRVGLRDEHAAAADVDHGGVAADARADEHARISDA